MRIEPPEWLLLASSYAALLLGALWTLLQSRYPSATHDGC